MTSSDLLYTLWGDERYRRTSESHEAALDDALGRLGSSARASTCTPGALVDAVKDVCCMQSYDTVALHDLGTAAMFLHAQHNVVGPFKSSLASATSVPDTELLGQLAENGEDFLGIVFHPEYLLIAKIAFGTLSDAHATPEVSFWNFRVAACVQYLLAERSQVLLDRITSSVAALVEAYSLSVGDENEGDDDHRRYILVVVHLEAANAFSAFGMVAEMREHVEAAQRILGMTAALTGSLGMRTVHQQDAHAQLVAKVTTGEGVEGDEKLLGRFEGPALDDMAFKLVFDGGNNGEDSKTTMSEFRGFESDSDVFRGGPKLLEESEAIRTDLHALHQLVVLALCGVVKKSSSPDGTQPWELTAYAECVLAQERTEFLLRMAAYMELSRLEIQRSRTRERALCTMEGIKESLCHVEGTDQVAPADRMRYAFTCKSPPRAALWKELGEAFVACGLIGAAIKMFEEAELWDSLIVCYQLLQKNEIAEQLVRTRLEVTPDDARLWCTLGDLVDEDEHYNTAWSCSNGRSARAQRSLARSAMRRDDFELASDCWERALALSPLHLEAWFSLGWCNLKASNYEKAATALTRLVQMDPDDGRAWNNLATVHMKMENWPEAMVAFGEASKHSRETWQTWENYAHVAFQVGDLNTSARALEHMVGLTRGETYNPKLVRSLVDALEGIDLDAGSDTSTVSPNIITTTEQQLVNYVSNVLKKIATSSKGAASPGFWKTYAAYYAITGAPASRAECLTKHVRGLATSTWHAADDTFDEYAESCVELARANLEIDPPSKSALSQSRMLLRSALQRSLDLYEDRDATLAMQRALGDVHDALDRMG